MISLFVALGQWFWGLLESAIERVESWLSTRELDVAMGGLPACLVAMVLVFIVCGQRLKPTETVAEPYRRGFREAASVNDFDRAELFFKKLVELQEADAVSRFQFVQLADAAGKIDKALEHLRLLAPENRVGYPPAHLWIAQQAIRHQETWKPDDLPRCVHHLDAAKSNSSIQPKAAELLGLLHSTRHDFHAAIEELKSISEPTLEVDVLLAMALQLAGQLDDSKNAWLKVANACERKLKEIPDQVDVRLLLAIADSHLQMHDRAVRVLRDGLQSGSNASDTRLHEALGLALIQRLQVTVRLPDDASKREEILKEMVDLAPDAPAVVMRLIRWREGDVRETQAIYEELSERAEAGDTTATALNALYGMARGETGQLPGARARLDRAFERDPHNPVIWNNLASVLANSQPPELDRALELANAALRVFPHNAEFRETRGQILLRQGKWLAAVEDLEWALAKMKPPSRHSVHAALAEAYEQLRNPEKVAFHRAQVAALETPAQP